MRIRNLTCQLTAVLIVAAAPMMASAAVVKPSDLSSLLLWYRGDDLTATHADGDAVTSVTDASTNTNDASTPAGFSDPTFAVTDLPLIRFDAAVKDALAAQNTKGDTGPGDITILAVYKTDNTADGESRPTGFGGSSFTSSIRNHINLADDPSLRFDGAAITAGYSDPVPNSEYFIRAMTRSGNTFNEFYNKTQVLPNTTQTLSAIFDEYYLGDLHPDGQPGGDGAANHEIAEVIVYDRALSDTERSSVENYLQAKYFSTAYYRAEEGADGDPASSVLDHTVNTHNLSASSGNEPTFSTDTPNAVVPLTGSANNLSFDFERGSGQYLSIADTPDLSFGDASFTIEAYVKFESAPTNFGSNRQYLAWKKADTGVSDTQLDYGIVFAENGGYGATQNGELVFSQGDGSTLNNVASGLTLTDTADWHFVSVAFDADNDLVRFVLDDQIVTMANTFTATENNHPLLIGAHFSGSQTLTSFDGLIDELRITNEFLPTSSLLSIPTPAALPAGLALMGLITLRRRRHG